MEPSQHQAWRWGRGRGVHRLPQQSELKAGDLVVNHRPFISARLYGGGRAAGPRGLLAGTILICLRRSSRERSCKQAAHSSRPLQLTTAALSPLLTEGKSEPPALSLSPHPPVEVVGPSFALRWSLFNSPDLVTAAAAAATTTTSRIPSAIWPDKRRQRTSRRNKQKSFPQISDQWMKRNMTDYFPETSVKMNHPRIRGILGLHQYNTSRSAEDDFWPVLWLAAAR